MHNLEEISAALATTVRFSQSVDPDAPVLDTDLIEPTSARLVYHPLLININLSALAPEASAATDPLFNDWLRELRLEAARELFSDVIRRKKNDQVTKEMLDNFVLYSGTGRLNDQVTKKGRLVGYEIRLLNSNNIKVIIDRIMLQFSGVETFNLYLYYSENPTAIATIPVTTTDAGKAEWTVSGQELLYRDFENDIAGGAYYLMYDEDDLVGQAINRKINFGRPCTTCNRVYYNRYLKFSQYVKIQTVSISSGSKPSDPTEMFDIEKVTYEPDNTYGLNFSLSSFCDLTDYSIDHKDLFADALAKQVIYRLMQALLSSTRSNIVTEKIKDNARFALQNAELGGENLTKELENAKKALGFELSDIQNSVCMPSIAAKGIKFTTVGNGRSQNSGRGGRYGNY